MKLVACLLLVFVSAASAADSVDVTFRYDIAGFPSGLSVPGEFNGWSSSAWPMTYTGGTIWIRNARLAVGGNPAGGIPGAWQYKFYYTGVTTWPNDPLNHHVNAADNNNSFLYVRDPTIYQFVPNQRTPLVTTSTPTISAYLFPKVGNSVDTSALALTIDGVTYTGLGNKYDAGTRHFAFTPPPLPNGSHQAILTAGLSADTVTLVTQGGVVRLLHQFPISTWKTLWTPYGLVDNPAGTPIKIIRNGLDTFSVTAASGSFSFNAPLVDGANSFVATADSAGVRKVSSPVVIQQIVSHAPSASIGISASLSQVSLVAQATAPDSGETAAVTYLWASDTSNPSVIPGVDGSTSGVVKFTQPSVPGEYYFTLTVSA